VDGHAIRFHVLARQPRACHAIRRGCARCWSADPRYRLHPRVVAWETGLRLSVPNLPGAFALPECVRSSNTTGLRFCIGGHGGPFSLDGIRRRDEVRAHYTAQIWTLAVNWPGGEISFEATGFEQIATGDPLITDRQWLELQEREQLDR
jgi:hypothetical protein